MKPLNHALLSPKIEVWEIGQMTVLEKDIVSDSHLPIFPNFRLWDRKWMLTAKRDSSKMTRD